MVTEVSGNVVAEPAPAVQSLLAGVLRRCADAFDEANADAAPPEPETAAAVIVVEDGEVLSGAPRQSRMSLAADCPKALRLLPHPVLGELDIAGHAMDTEQWRDLAGALERVARPPIAPSSFSGLDGILAELDPEPLSSVDGDSLWRERMRAWVVRQLRRLFSEETAFGRWVRGLTPEDLQGFSDTVLAGVLVLFCLLVALFAVLAFRFLQRRRGRRPEHRVELPELLASVPLLPLEAIRDLPAAGQPLALMRLVLARIEAAGLCSTRASMTNSEVARSLREGSGLRIDGLALLADRCQFGGHEASAAELEPCYAELRTLESTPA
jgi:hypothetical protein